jgi:hypothetical protein
MAIRDKFGSAQLQTQPVVAGDRAYAKIQKGRSNRYWLATAQATLTITTAVTAILGLGSVWQLFDAIGMDEGGAGSWTVDPRMFIALSEALCKSKRTATRVTSLSASPVTLREQILIPFEYLDGAKPGETRFRERDLSVDTSFFYVLNGLNNGIAKLVTGGVATITNVTVQLEQYFDNDDDDITGMSAPLFRPWFEQKRLPVVGASPNFFIDVTTKDLIEGITILQNTTGKGMVTDIINKIGLTSTDTNFIGQGQYLNYDEFARAKEYEYGGDVYAGPAGGVVHHNFRYGGRLSNLLNPNQASTIQLVFDVQPSGVAGAVSSEIIVLFSTLQRYPFQRKQDGVWVTNPVLPANLAG